MRAGENSKHHEGLLHHSSKDVFEKCFDFIRNVRLDKAGMVVKMQILGTK